MTCSNKSLGWNHTLGISTAQRKWLKRSIKSALKWANDTVFWRYYMSLRSEQVQVPPAAVTRRPSHHIHSFDFPFPSGQGFCAHSLGCRGQDCLCWQRAILHEQTHSTYQFRLTLCKYKDNLLPSIIKQAAHCTGQHGNPSFVLNKVANPSPAWQCQLHLPIDYTNFKSGV